MTETSAPRVTWAELFYDLIVVASVSHGSHVFGEHPSWGMGTWLAASLVLLMTFWLLTMLSHNLYPGEDTPRRFLIFVQMPAGVPVATVAIGNARNAGLLAARILGVADDDLREAMVTFQADLNAAAKAKGQNLAR